MWPLPMYVVFQIIRQNCILAHPPTPRYRVGSYSYGNPGSDPASHTGSDIIHHLVDRQTFLKTLPFLAVGNDNMLQYYSDAWVYSMKVTWENIRAIFTLVQGRRGVPTWPSPWFKVAVACSLGLRLGSRSPWRAALTFALVQGRRGVQPWPSPWSKVAVACRLDLHLGSRSPWRAALTFTLRPRSQWCAALTSNVDGLQTHAY